MKALPALLAIPLLAGCAGFSGRGLVPGQSSAQDVEALMGPVTEVRGLPGGGSLRYYSREPYGREIYVARIGADGKLRGIEQRLDWVNVHAVREGMRAEEVRERLGPPFEVTRWPRQQRDVWEYPYRHAVRERRVLFVQFSYDGVVREVIERHDYDRDPENDFGGR